MKKFIIAAVAASFIATPVLAAPNDYRDNRGRIEQRHDDRGRYDNQRNDNGRYDNHRDNRGKNYNRAEYRKWKKGDRFDRRYANNYRVISSPKHYRLREAPRGYRWVQSGNDAVLIGIASGIIAAITYNAIR